VFSDLEGFTSFTSERGDLEASALLSDHYDAVESITRGKGGHVVKKIGDGHMLSFNAPSAAVMALLDLTAAAAARFGYERARTAVPSSRPTAI